jgi:hypothetical protein
MTSENQYQSEVLCGYGLYLLFIANDFSVKSGNQHTNKKTAFYQHIWTSVFRQLLHWNIKQLNMRLPEDGAYVH